VATALDAQPDVQETPALLAQQQQGLKHLVAQSLGLDQLKGNTCGLLCNNVTQYNMLLVTATRHAAGVHGD
jgi:hypothetical protein